MDTLGKDVLVRRVVAGQLAAFVLVIVVIWLDEILDVPHFLFAAESTPVNWREALFETLVIAPLGGLIVFYTRKLLAKMKYLEGFLPTCSSCRKIRDDQGRWQSMEAFIHERSAARFSHGICPQCARKLYPEIFTEDDTDSSVPIL